MEVDYPQVEESSTTQAPPKAANSAPSITHIAELKSGKVIWKQKPLACDKLSETLQEIMTFRLMAEGLDAPLETIPELYHPVIAKLVHGSDKTIATLAKNVQQELLPPTIDDSQEDDKETPPPVVPLEVVEKAIQSVATRANWGIDNGVAAVCVWRWEVNDRSWLPKQIQDKAEVRYQERVEAKKALSADFDTLSDTEQNAMLRGKAGKRTRSTVDGDGKENAPGTSERKKAGRSKKSEPAVGEAATEAEKEKTIKAEKTKKAEAWTTGKSATMFSAWLSKPAVKPSTSEPKPAKVTTPTVSDFESSFRPFAVKKNVDLAPSNYFEIQAEMKEAPGREIIELNDDGDLVNVSAKPKEKSLPPYPKDSLLPFGGPSSCPSTSHSKRNSNSCVRSSSKHSVKELMSRITEAAEEGDYTTTSDLAKLLADRKIIPLRFMNFSHEGRPEYIGTWTKSSATVGPRTPFATDAATDYEVEGIDAWLEEEESEADDLVGLEDDEDMDEDGDSEDDWIVSDDVVELLDGPEVQGSPYPSISLLPDVGKRKAEGDAMKSGMKRRKIVTTLVPEIQGPIWEPAIGECTKAFEGYQIRLLNGTPFPINPFTFIPEISQRHKPTSSSRQTKTADGFVVPAIPDRLKPGDSSTSVDGLAPVKKRGSGTSSQPAPKTTIPDSLLPEFIAKVHGSTSTRAVLIDEVYQALKDRGAKKNAVEAKFKEIAVKEKGTKKWVVVEEVRKSVGLA